MEGLFSLESFALLTGGVVLGIFAVVVGGAMFVSVPLLQWLFPQATFGVLVGNIKVGSFFRSIGSTYATRHKISYIENFKLSILAFIGTILGSSIIANLSQGWLIVALLMAIALSEAAPRVAKLITPRVFHVASFLTGVYTGLLGAGIGILLIALLRLKHPKEEEIGYVKIQARFVEWLLTITAVGTHFFHGNLVTSIWVPWSIGGLIGGYIGGLALNKLTAFSGSTQRGVLKGAYAISLLTSAQKALSAVLGRA